jgi:hypothetical protein
MAITFDPINKIIQLDTFSVSEREMWTSFVDWSVQSDNLKFGVGMTQLGGLAPVALYITLATGWRIRPLAQAGITTITGNVLTAEGTSPVEQAVGAVQVNLETPVKAVAISTGQSGLTTAEAANIGLIPALL